MTKSASDAIDRIIAMCGHRSHLIHRIMRHLNAKPVLIILSFWDEELYKTYKPNPKPTRFYGGEPMMGIHCAVENSSTAFALSLANKYTKELADRERIPQSEGDVALGIPSTYPWCESDLETGDEVPIDYHFLYNFHTTNLRHVSGRRIMYLGSECNPLNTGCGQAFGTRRWPNLVVRGSELADVFRTWKMPYYDEMDRTSLYVNFFGVLASPRIRLQGYFVLMNAKADDNDRIIERWRESPDHGPIKYNDITRRELSDLTAASPADLEACGETCLATHIERCLTGWDDLPDIEHLDAYFVRWKTTEELQEEERKKKEILEGQTQACDGCHGDSLSTKDLLRRWPVRGFYRNLKAYMWREKGYKMPDVYE